MTECSHRSFPKSNLRTRCAWCPAADLLYTTYHDEEWGVPRHDESSLFESLSLECTQAGLSWITILRKRQTMRTAFANFDADKVAQFGSTDIHALMDNPGVIRHRQKIQAIIANAQATVALRTTSGGLDTYLWSFVDGRPLINTWDHAHQVPASTPLSDKISHDLKQRGFRFIGSTTCYAWMQAVGLVNDHTTDCFRHPACPRETP